MLDNFHPTPLEMSCYSIDEVSKMFGVNPWMIRPWVNRFYILSAPSTATETYCSPHRP
jgi:transposase